MTRPRFAAVLLVALFVPVVSAQQSAEPKPGDAMIDRYLAEQTARISKRFLDGATTLDE